MSDFIFETVKIKPEHKRVATGRIAKCGLSGSEFIFGRAKLNFRAYVQVKELNRLLILPFSQDLGMMNHWQFELYVAKVRYDRLPALPFMAGDEVTVEYNQKRPKKCNLIKAAKMNLTGAEE